MAPFLVIEVIGGPLDGLRACGVKDRLSIGRQVGNSLTLAIDQAVSGYHAEIVLEGNVWCLRDLGSTNGTWLDGQRVEHKANVPLESECQILVGTNSVLRVFLNDKALAPVHFNAHEVDLRTLEPMDSDFALFLTELYQEKPAFLDSILLYNRLGQAQTLGVLAGFFQQQDLTESIEPWIEQKRSANRAYRLAPDIVTIAPRVLQIFTDVEEGATLSLRCCIDVILAQRSICGKNNEVLQRWLDTVQMPEIVDDVEQDLESEQEEVVAETPAPLQSISEPEPTSESEPEVTVESEVVPKVSVPSEPEPVVERREDPQKALFQDFILQTEKIVLGFIKDAVHPTTVPDHFALPGFAYTAEEMLEKSDAEKSEQFFKDYLPVLISSLKVVLVAQREGASNYPDKLDEQLTDILEEIKKGSMFDQFRQSSGLSPADRIRGVLKSAEASGLGEHLIRERIREKMKIIRLTREEKS